MKRYLAKIKKKIYKLFHPSIGEILMLHRVVNERSLLEANRLMEVTPEFLEKTIVGYLEQGRPIISLDEVSEIVNKRKKLKQPFVCFTFDDGYKDNYELAYPIFKKYNVPFAIYVTTDFIQGKGILWWYLLEKLLLNNDLLVLSDGTTYNVETIDEKSACFYEIRSRLSKVMSNNAQTVFEELFKGYLFSMDSMTKYLIMNEEQVEELASDSICTIASHGVSHSYLANLSSEQLLYELSNSKLKLEELTGNDIFHFAYPYGQYNDYCLKAVENCGYKTSVLAWGGAVRKFESVYKMNRVLVVE